MPNRSADTIEHLLHAFRASSNEVERWNIAQALTAVVSPKVQAGLDELRREIIIALTTQAPHISSGPKRNKSQARAVLTAKHHKTKIRWSDFELTPEIDMQASMLGKTIPVQQAKRLKRLLTQQIATINDLLRKPK